MAENRTVDSIRWQRVHVDVSTPWPIIAIRARELNKRILRMTGKATGKPRLTTKRMRKP